MKITFTGKQDKLTAPQERKLAMAFARLSKQLDRRGEKGAQVILTEERHLRHAEVRVNFYDNMLIGAGAATDQFTAVMDALEKLEKQALKTRAKWRETKRAAPLHEGRTSATMVTEAAMVPKKAAAKKAAAKSKPSKVVRANGKNGGKPMTVDEALLVMEDERDYMVYRDSETDKVSVLIRRRDGKVDLVEA